MKLIIEHKNDGNVYTYTETEEHHKATEPDRQKELKLRTLQDQDEGCLVPPGTYVVADISDPDECDEKGCPSISEPVKEFAMGLVGQLRDRIILCMSASKGANDELSARVHWEQGATYMQAAQVVIERLKEQM